MSIVIAKRGSPTIPNFVENKKPNKISQMEKLRPIREIFYCDRNTGDTPYVFIQVMVNCIF